MLEEAVQEAKDTLYKLTDLELKDEQSPENVDERLALAQKNSQRNTRRIRHIYA